MLTLSNVKKYYDRILALDIPSLQLPPGIYWIKGPNGSGKTTLLRTVAGLLPFDGNIIFNGIDQRKRPVEYRAVVSWSDAEPLFPGFMTGIELIDFCRSIRKATEQEAHALTEQFGMHSYLGQKVNSYSSGMTKKLSLVLAFLGNTPLMILDEPLITLDQEAVQTLSHMIQKKFETSGTSFLLSSHMDPDDSVFANARILDVNEQQVTLL